MPKKGNEQSGDGNQSVKTPGNGKVAQLSGSRQKGRAEEEEKGAENNPLREVLLEELADIYNAEQQLIKGLPKMAKAAESDELREAFEAHLEETQEQARRIEQAVEEMGEKLQRKKCAAMEGLLTEAKELMEDHDGEPTIDAVLVAAAQKVEHYEIASYGTVVAWAKLLGEDELSETLQTTLDEEKATDEKLTQIAESVANLEAQEEESEEEEKK